MLCGIKNQLFTNTGSRTSSYLCRGINVKINYSISTTLYPQHTVHWYTIGNTGWLLLCFGHKDKKLKNYKDIQYISQWWATQFIRPYCWSLSLTFSVSSLSLNLMWNLKQLLTNVCSRTSNYLRGGINMNIKKVRSTTVYT